MKPATQTIVTIAIAITFGAGGYFLGKSQTGGISRSDATSPGVPRKEIQRPIASRPELPNIDPGALKVTLDAEKNPLTRFKLALQNLEAWVDKNPQDALDWLATQQASDRRDEVIRMALNQYSDIDAKGAAEWALKNLSGADLNNTIISIAENWAMQNGGEAATWFMRQPETAERDAAMENIFFTWAANEPTGALDFLKANPDVSALAPVLRRAALAGWAKSDPLGAVAASLTLSQANGDPDQFANTVANWATIDLETSSQWLLTNLPAGVERSAAAQELATIFAQQSPDAGLVWLDQLAAGDERNVAASALVSSWSRISPAEAAKWAVTQHSSTLTPEALGIMADNYFMKNPVEFEAWRATLPPGVMRNQASKAGGVGADE